jgi:hypothetical protein
VKIHLIINFFTRKRVIKYRDTKFLKDVVERKKENIIEPLLIIGYDYFNNILKLNLENDREVEPIVEPIEVIEVNQNELINEN